MKATSRRPKDATTDKDVIDDNKTHITIAHEDNIKTVVAGTNFVVTMTGMTDMPDMIAGIVVTVADQVTVAVIEEATTPTKELAAATPLQKMTELFLARVSPMT